MTNDNFSYQRNRYLSTRVPSGLPPSAHASLRRPGWRPSSNQTWSAKAAISAARWALRKTPPVTGGGGGGGDDDTLTPFFFAVFGTEVNVMFRNKYECTPGYVCFLADLLAENTLNDFIVRQEIQVRMNVMRKGEPSTRDG